MKKIIIASILLSPLLLANNPSVKTLMKECEQKNSNSCLEIGKGYDTGSFVKKNFGKSEFYFKKACALLNPEACYMIALKYKANASVQLDAMRYKLYIKKSCKLGYKKACGLVGSLDEDR